MGACTQETYFGGIVDQVGKVNAKGDIQLGQYIQCSMNS